MKEPPASSGGAPLERYYKFSQYFKDTGHKERVLKITVDAGFSCPNRDGKLSYDGCIYCNNEGFSPNTKDIKTSIKEQIELGIAASRKNNKDARFLVYFQAFTNTYAPLEKLKVLYDNVKAFPEVAGIAIGTRPDCINDRILELINSYTKDYEVWVEYGLQSIHDDTLQTINRGHTYQQFLEAFKLTRKYKKIKICVHLILGLPGENKEQIIQTAKAMGKLQVDGIKLHPMHIIKGTKLEEEHKAGKIKIFELKDYAELVQSFLEHLWPKTVIQRLSADCPKELLVAPLWLNDKTGVLKAIDDKLLEKNSYQGKYWS